MLRFHWHASSLLVGLSWMRCHYMPDLGFSLNMKVNHNINVYLMPALSKPGT